MSLLVDYAIDVKMQVIRIIYIPILFFKREFEYGLSFTNSKIILTKLEIYAYNLSNKIFIDKLVGATCMHRVYLELKKGKKSQKSSNYAHYDIFILNVFVTSKS